MASTTAEVLLYFGTDDPEFLNVVDSLRFSAELPLETAEIIKLIQPIWTVAYERGYDDGLFPPRWEE